MHAPVNLQEEFFPAVEREVCTPLVAMEASLDGSDEKRNGPACLPACLGEIGEMVREVREGRRHDDYHNLLIA